mgnify:CR=1 FL=1
MIILTFILAISLIASFVIIWMFIENDKATEKLYNELHQLEIEERDNLKHDYEDQIRQLNFKITYCNDSLKSAEEQIEAQSVMENSLRQALEHSQQELKDANALIVKLDFEKTQSKTTKPKKVKNATQNNPN